MRPALVLLPGMDGTGDLFEPFIQALGDDIDSIVVSYPNEPLDYAGHATIARAALPLDRPYVILGESFSGPIAISIAAAKPRGLMGYVLCASFARSPYRVLTWLRPLLGFLAANRAPLSIEQYVLLGRFATPALRKLHAATMKKVGAATLVGRARGIAGCDVTADLKRVGLPGLYLCATEDRIVPRSAAQCVERIAPNLRAVEILGPHLLLQACAQESARVVREFMETLA